MAIRCAMMAGHSLWVGTLLLLMIAARASLGVTLVVPDDYERIELGLDAAQSGDTVLVRAGTYGEDTWIVLNFRGKDVVLRSESGPSQTIVGVHPNGVVVWFENNESAGAVLDGFTLANGAPACVLVKGRASPTIRNCRIIQAGGQGGDPPPPYAGGLLCMGESAPLVRACVFEDNDVPALSAVENAEPLLEDCLFRDNSTVDVQGNAGVTLRRCTVKENIGVFYTPILIRSSGFSLLEDCLVILNGNGEYGAIVIDSPGGLVRLVGCTIAGNEGGVFLMDGRCEIERCILRDNYAECGFRDFERGGGTSRFECCALPPGLNEYPPYIEFVGEQVQGDPGFCRSDVCPNVFGSDYHLREGSPCLPDGNSCGVRIGALEEGCSAPEEVGACCLDDEECSLVDAVECDAMGGTFLGLGTTCEADPCPATVRVGVTWGSVRASYR